MRKPNDFDAIAPFYDRLKRLVFGKSVDESQLCFLNRIKGGKVLVLGGGSGEILVAILQSFPKCDIWYVDASSKMISLAQERLKEKVHNVKFIYGTQDSVSSDIRFDTVITNFFLDLFPDEKVNEITGMVARWLDQGGHWIITDFVDDGKKRHNVLLHAMYIFFRIVCGIPADRLPSWQMHAARNGFSELASKGFFGGFIRASLWLRSMNHPA